MATPDARVRGPTYLPREHDDRAPDAVLLERLAGDDASALDTLLARYWQPLTLFITRLTGSVEAAEDAVQEAFCRLWERRRSWRGEGSVNGLLFRLARNSAISAHRREDAEARAASVAVEAMPLHHEMPAMPNDELRAALEHAIAELAPRRREVFLLRVVHDLSYKEIAAVMGTSTQTVANQLSTALRELRTRLSGLE